MSTDPVRRSSQANRRTVLAAGVAAGVAASSALLGLESHGFAAPLRLAQANSITEENSKPGTRDWMLTKTQIDPATKYRCPWIEGYVSHASIQPGELLQVMVSTDPVSDFTIDFYRLGFYGGDGGRHVAASGKLTGSAQPMPEVGVRRLQNCQWKPSFELRIPEDWVSGVYVGKLTELQQGLQSYVIFVVRDQRRSDLVFQVSDHTWHAYNRWPSQFSLYDDGENQWHWVTSRRSASIGLMASIARSWTRRCRSVQASSFFGSFRLRSGWKSRGTT